MMFKYEDPLHDSSKTQTIRLIDLDPGQGSAPLSCQLRCVSLSSQPVYAALSYSWGGQTPSEKFSCNGQSLLVTRNLHAALRRFRNVDSVVTVWADAICINQQDVDEKNQQVPLMGKIFSQAKEVKVWLDPSDKDDTELAVERITELVQLAQFYAEKLSLSMHDLQDFDDTWRWGSVKLDDITRLDFNAKWDPLFRLLQNVWFSRVWIIQEVALSGERAWLYYGDNILSWKDLVTALCFASHTDILSQTMRVRGDETARAVMRATRLVRTTGAVADSKGAGLGLFWLLCMHWESAATDPRDNIYGLLSIARNHEVGDPDTPFITPDYHSDVAALYQQVAEKFLARFSWLVIIEFAGRRTAKDGKVPGLPSWVPDWSQLVNVAMHLPLTLDENLEMTFEPDFLSFKDIVPKWYRVNGSILTLQGYFVDEIVETSDIFNTTREKLALPDTDLTERGFLWCKNLFGVAKFWGYSCESDIYSPTGKNLIDSIVETLSLGQPPTDLPATEIRAILAMFIKRGQMLTEFENSSPPRLTRDHGEEAQELVSTIECPWTAESMGGIVHGLRHLWNFIFAFKTKKGHMGMMSSLAIEVGDRIALVRGLLTPTALRPRSDGMWSVIGETYTHGIMEDMVSDVEKCHDILIA
ncbi:hypothetical protein FSARC_10363 [Fusarium sarcochroum]|uniref:Heterokaryon incompatibility domain-containing protein n=1 Tax=Fusarium sarcochroum TaxID=1208366 RepID=A0A8H4X4L7_9HYPO|nr:hypothetical protein FSARC_10363 [Fusarium sarcochroum]